MKKALYPWKTMGITITVDNTPPAEEEKTYSLYKRGGKVFHRNHKRPLKNGKGLTWWQAITRRPDLKTYNDYLGLKIKEAVTAVKPIL